MRGAKSATRSVKRAPREGPAAELAACKRELAEARAERAATAEILKTISQSTSDPRPVFEKFSTPASACSEPIRRRFSLSATIAWCGWRPGAVRWSPRDETMSRRSKTAALDMSRANGACCISPTRPPCRISRRRCANGCGAPAACRCYTRRCWPKIARSAQSLCCAPRSARSASVNRRCCKALPIRPRLQSRIRGCSAKRRRRPATSRNRSRSRQRRRTC